MSNRSIDSGKNSPYRRGIVTQLDPANGRAKVQFSDEDGQVSFWLNVNQQATGANKSYWMPDQGSQVNCLVDWDGEDGSIIGALYSQADLPPTTDPNHIMTQTSDGSIFQYDQGSRTLRVKIGPSEITVSPAGIILKAPRIDHQTG